jgi:methyl-accepting chemotaxis protein
MPLSASLSCPTCSPPSTMSLSLLLLALFCACALLASLHVKSFTPTTFVSAPVLIVLIVHLLTKMTTGIEAAPRVFTNMMQNPVRAVQALVSATICQLPLPPWLGEWLNTLATRMADLQRINGQTHEEVFAIGGLLRELSDLLQNLTSTFDEFTARTAHIAELATHVPIAMVELMEAARHDNAMISNISQQITDLDTRVAQAHGDLLELHQCVEQRTSYVEDGELRLALNTILACISHLATADQV